MVFLVDGSWSVGRPNFKYIRSFMSATASAFQIGEEKTRVGVVQYSNDTRTEFNLNTHLTRPALLRAIGSLPYKGGDTMTGAALLLLVVVKFHFIQSGPAFSVFVQPLSNLSSVTF